MAANSPFWIISVPAKPTADATISTIEAACTGLATATRFAVPAKLRVGTLDLLMSMSDELVKLDHVIEHTSRKLGNQIWSFMDPKPEKGEIFLSIRAASIVDFLRNFEWDTAKYPIRLSVKELAERFQQQVGGIEEEFRSRLTEYSSLAHSVAQYERSLTANLTIRDLTDLVDIDEIIDSDFLITLFVVCHKNQEKEWEQIYDTFDNSEDPVDPKAPNQNQPPPQVHAGERPQIVKFVVPGSSRKVHTDGDQCLMSVTLLKKFKNDFIRKAQKQKYTVREVKIDKENFVSGKENQKRLKNELSTHQNKFLMWCKTNFAETFSAWAHLKALRIHVEAILRFGLPPKNVAALIQLDKPGNEKKLRSLLDLQFAEYASKYIKSDKASDDMSAFVTNEQFYPYVYMEMNLNYARE